MIIDTFAWIEIAEGTPRGAAMREMIRKEKSYTHLVTIAEIAYWCEKNGRNPNDVAMQIGNVTPIISFASSGAIEAGKLKHRLRQKISEIGLIDCIIYSSALCMGQDVLTGDPHFKGLPFVRMVE